MINELKDVIPPRNCSDNVGNDIQGDAKLHKPSTNINREWTPPSEQYSKSNANKQYFIYDYFINFFFFFYGESAYDVLIFIT